MTVNILYGLTSKPNRRIYICGYQARNAQKSPTIQGHDGYNLFDRIIIPPQRGNTRLLVHAKPTIFFSPNLSYTCFRTSIILQRPSEKSLNLTTTTNTTTTKLKGILDFICVPSTRTPQYNLRAIPIYIYICIWCSTPLLSPRDGQSARNKQSLIQKAPITASVYTRIYINRISNAQFKM